MRRALGCQLDMQHGTGNRDYAPVGRDRDVDQRRLAISQPVELGGRLIAEYGAVTSSQHRRPESCFPVRLARESHIYTRIYELPSAATEPAPYRPAAHACRSRLASGDHATLHLSEIAERWRHVVAHDMQAFRWSDPLAS